MQYTIRSGDSLSRIAAVHGTTLQALLDANPQYRDRPGIIHVGDVILIPSGDPPGLAEAGPPAFSPAASWILGSLSSKYETGGRGPGTVSSGIGDAGGVSYGSYQMTSRPRGGTVARFVAEGPFHGASGSPARSRAAPRSAHTGKRWRQRLPTPSSRRSTLSSSAPISIRWSARSRRRTDWTLRSARPRCRT